MGFNFGAFAGGLAKSGVDTYVRLSEEERRDAEAKRQSEIHALRLKEEAENDQLKAAYSETLGRAETPEAWRTAGGERGPVQQLGLPTTPVDPNQPAVSPEETAKMFPAQKMYSRDQATQDYRNKVMGINPIKGSDVVSKMQGLEKGDLEIGELKDTVAKRKSFDAYQDKLKNEIPKLRSDIETELSANGLSGAVKKYGSDFTKITGYTPSVIGNELVIKDKDGKVIQKLNSHDEVLNGLSDVLGKKLNQDALSGMLTAGVFRNPKEMQEYFLAQSTMKTQESNAAANTSNAAVARDKLAADLKAGIPAAQAAEAWAKVRNYNADANLREAQAKAMKEKTGLWQLVGTDDDGQPISYDRNTGNFARPDAKPIQSVDVFKRLSGEKVPKEPISNKDIIDFVDKFGDAPSNKKDVKGLPIPIRMLPPAEQRAYAEDFFQKGTGTGKTGGLKDDVKPEARNPETPAAPAKSALPRPSRPAAASGVPAETPMPSRSVVYGKTVYKMPGMLAGFNTPEEAQAAWAQKNAPLAPQTFD